MTKSSQSYKSKYRIKEKLKNRSLPHFSVYKATQLGLDRYVEIRVFKVKTSQAKDTVLKRFEREYKILAKLDHPNILKILDLGIESDCGFYVTDLREAQSIAEHLNEGKKFSSPSEALKLCMEIGKALAYIHDKDILHRDLSINNIFYDSENDFFYMGSFSQGKESFDQDITARGIPFISPLISTPEIIEGLPVDNRTDIYLLGRIMYQLLSGSKDLPHYNEFEKETLDVTSLDARPIKEFNNEVPDSLDLLIRKMIAAKPEKRFQNCSHLLKEAARVKKKLESLETLKQNRQELIRKKIAKREKEKLEKGSKDAPAESTTLKDTDSQAPEQKDARQKSKISREPVASLSILDYIEIFDEVSPLLKYALAASLLPVLLMVFYLVKEPSAESASYTPPAATGAASSPSFNKSGLIDLEKILSISTPTDSDNFQERYSLISAYRRSFPHKERQNIVSYNHLIEARVAFYNNDEEGCKMLDEIIRTVKDYAK